MDVTRRVAAGSDAGTRVRRHRVLLGALVAGVLVAGAAAGAYSAYPGMAHGLANQFWYADFAQNRNLYRCLEYWLRFMQALRLNVSTQIYGFERQPGPGADEFTRGQFAYHRGEFRDAIRAFEESVARLGESEERLFWLAMAHMRGADIENCLAHILGSADGLPTDHGAAAEYCVLPVARFQHLRASGERAAALYERLLDVYGPNRLYQWLLNVNWMVLGGFPERVTEKYRVQGPLVDTFYGERGAAMAETHRDLRFVERARQLHVATHNTGRGVAVEDFDRDGDLDFVTGGSFELVTYYRNESGREFSDQTDAVGLGNITQPFILVAADVDNDGWPDLFISRPFGRYSLYRNAGGRFHDVTASYGLFAGMRDEEIAATWVPAFSDVDNDGDLDLFVAQWGFRLPFVTGLMARPRSDSKLFVNESGRFVDRTREYGLGATVRDQYFIGSAFGDYDGDGYDDLFLSSPLLNTSVLLHNVGGRRFEPSRRLARAEGGFATAFVDVDQDGRLDLFQGGFGDARTNTAQAVFGEGRWTHRAGHSTVFVQQPDGRFNDHSDMFDLPMSTMGSSFGDVDNDGCIDFYLGTGNPEGWFVLPNLMYMGRPAERGCAPGLDNVSMLFGLGTLQKGHGIVFFDFDGDGDEDIYSSLGGMWPGDAWPNQMFVNETVNANRWVGVRLRGRRTNWFGLGARVIVHARTADGVAIERHAVMNNKTGFGSAPYLLHVGLGRADRIDAVEVRWPASRCVHRYAAALDRVNLLDEQACFGSDAQSASGPLSIRRESSFVGGSTRGLKPPRYGVFDIYPRFFK